MKNKTFISFVINLLIGIIFSFPVFSGQLFAQYDIMSDFEDNVIEVEPASAFFSDFRSDAANFSPKNQLNNFTNPKLIKKNRCPGKVDDTKINLSLPGFRKYSSPEIFSEKQNLILTFVNLSYLKDLKITKMLC